MKLSLSSRRNILIIRSVLWRTLRQHCQPDVQLCVCTSLSTNTETETDVHKKCCQVKDPWWDLSVLLFWQHFTIEVWCIFVFWLPTEPTTKCQAPNITAVDPVCDQNVTQRGFTCRNNLHELTSLFSVSPVEGWCQTDPRPARTPERRCSTRLFRRRCRTCWWWTGRATDRARRCTLAGKGRVALAVNVYL